MRLTLPEYMAYVYTWSATRRAIAAERAGFFEAACQRMELVWEGKERAREVTMPLSIIAGVV
jgi:hypothetical protein